jgi:hypothetical protein
MAVAGERMASQAGERMASQAGERTALAEQECAASAEDVQLSDIAVLRWESPVSRQDPLLGGNLDIGHISRLCPDLISVAPSSAAPRS